MQLRAVAFTAKRPGAASKSPCGPKGGFSNRGDFLGIRSEILPFSQVLFNKWRFFSPLFDHTTVRAHFFSEPRLASPIMTNPLTDKTRSLVL